jgi:adenylylsulfate kinase
MLLNNHTYAIWITGLPASGKSTLANLLVEELSAYKIKTQVLDSDELRQVLTPNPKYSHEERDWFYKSLIYIGNLLTENDVNVIFAATAHLRIFRQAARRQFENFIEIYLQCPLDTCLKRDQKGIYQKALSGEVQNVPGVQELYEVPETPEIIVDTENKMPPACVAKIKEYLKQTE